MPFCGTSRATVTNPSRSLAGPRRRRHHRHRQRIGEQGQLTGLKQGQQAFHYPSGVGRQNIRSAIQQTTKPRPREWQHCLRMSLRSDTTKGQSRHHSTADAHVGATEKRNHPPGAMTLQQSFQLKEKAAHQSLPHTSARGVIASSADPVAPALTAPLEAPSPGAQTNDATVASERGSGVRAPRESDSSEPASKEHPQPERDR